MASRADVDRCSASRAPRQQGAIAGATTNSEIPCAPISHVPTRSCGDATLSSHASNGHRTRHPGGRLNGRPNSLRPGRRKGTKTDRTSITGRARLAWRPTGRDPPSRCRIGGLLTPESFILYPQPVNYPEGSTDASEGSTDATRPLNESPRGVY